MCNFIKKEFLAQVFSCEFCEIFKITFFVSKTPPAAASISLIKCFLAPENVDKPGQVSFCSFFLKCFINRDTKYNATDHFYTFWLLLRIIRVTSKQLVVMFIRFQQLTLGLMNLFS